MSVQLSIININEVADSAMFISVLRRRTLLRSEIIRPMAHCRRFQRGSYRQRWKICRASRVGDSFYQNF